MPKMDNSKSTPVVPPLEMDLLQQRRMDPHQQKQHDNLYKIRETDARRFLEDSLILLLANNFRSTLNDECDEAIANSERIRNASFRKRYGRNRTMTTDLEDVQFIWNGDDANALEQIHSARALMAERIAGFLASDGNCYLPPRSPRELHRNGLLEQKLNGQQLLNALAAKSKLILLVCFDRSMAALHQQQPPIASHKHGQKQTFANESAALPLHLLVASTNGHKDGDRHDEQNQLHWQQQLSFLPDQQSHSEEPRWAQSLPSRGRSRNDGQQLPNLLREWAHREEAATCSGKQQQQPRPWPVDPISGSSKSEHEQTPPRLLVTMDPLMEGKKEKVDTSTKQRQQQAAFPPFSSTSRSNQQHQPIGTANFEDRNGDWWSDNGGGTGEIADVVRRTHIGDKASIEPTSITRSASLRSFNVNNSGTLLLLPVLNDVHRDRANNQLTAQSGTKVTKTRTATVASISPSIRSNNGSPVEAAKEILLADSIADPQVTDLLLNYIVPIDIKQCVEHHQQKSVTQEHFGNNHNLPFVNRSKTVPVIKFRYCPTTEEESESRQNKHLQYTNNTQSARSPPEEALSPVTRSQNLLEAAINSLNRQVEEQRQFQASVDQRQQHNSRHPNNQLQNQQYKQQKEADSREHILDESAHSKPPEDLVLLFEELGFDLNKSISKNLTVAFEDSDQSEMAKTTNNWKNSFAAMRERFGGSEESNEMGVGETNNHGRQIPNSITNNGAKLPEQWHTIPRGSSAIGPTRLASMFPNKQPAGNQNKPRQQEEISSATHKNADISNFWLTMLKARAEANNTAASQRLPLGLSAAERLQQLQQEALQEEASRQSPSSVSSSAGSSSIDWTHQKYPYRKVGSVESVAIRRNNFLAEVNRVDSPRMMLFNGSPKVEAMGRATPTLRALKSPSHENGPNSGQIANNESEEELKKKGCGRFPTNSDSHHQQHIRIGTGLVMNAKGHSTSSQMKQSQQSEFIMIAEPSRNRSPDAMSESSQHSAMSSASRPSLPQPAPKHNLRDQLINAGYRVHNRQVPGSFFGGAANNPFFGGSQHHTSQQKQPGMSVQFRSNSPNFPSTNTVIARISELENRQQQRPSNMTTTQPQTHPPPPLYGMHQGELCIKPHSQQTILPNSGGQLSPGSTVFRTKPVIVFDLDLESEEKQLPQTIPTVKAQKAPEKVQNKAAKAANGAKKTIHEQQQNQKRVMLQKGIEGSDRSRLSPKVALGREFPAGWNPGN